MKEKKKKGFSHGKIWMLDSETESPTWDEWNQTNIYDEWDEIIIKGSSQHTSWMREL
jgi:hypothetical protein